MERLALIMDYLALLIELRLLKSTLIMELLGPGIGLAHVRGVCVVVIQLTF